MPGKKKKKKNKKTVLKNELRVVVGEGAQWTVQGTEAQGPKFKSAWDTE